MANLGQIYDAEQMPESTDFTPLPDGWYQAKVVKSELNDTKDGTGKYINNQYEILGPSYQGRMVFGMINIVNGGPKKDTVESIGQGQLRALMLAGGLTRVGDTDQLVGIECEIKLGLDKAKDGYEAKNVIKAFRAIEGSKRPAVTGGKPFGGKSFAKPDPVIPATSAPPVTKGKPWMSK